jgi:hypothetical protein
MADASSLGSLLGGMDLSFANPAGLGINILVSTIVGGIVILLIVEIFAKRYANHVKPINAFLLTFIASMINILGIMALLGGMVASFPMGSFISMLLPVFVWVILIKVLFKQFTMKHALMVGVVCYLLNIFLIPALVNMASGFVPVF